MRRLHSTAAAAAALVAMMTAAACGGSQLSPAEVRAANDAVAGQAASASGTTTGTTGTGSSESTGSTGGTGGTGGTGSAGTAGTTGSSGGSGGGGGPGSTGSTGGSTAPTGGSAAAGVPKGSCAGFKNQTGVTNSTITIGNASDISGPVPGLFTSAQQAVKAYVAYFNSTSSICGRKLALTTEDSRTDAGADQQAYTQLCASSFAAVGSMSAFDSGGAPTAQQCGLPDIRTASTTTQRNACTTCFAAQGSNANYYENAPADYFIKHDKAATQHAAILYINAGGAAQNAATMHSAFAKRGMKIDYFAGIDTTEFNYGPYVQAMKSKGIRYIIFLGPYQDTVRLVQTMQQAKFKPDVFLQDPTVYDPGYVKQAGSAGEGTYVYMNFVPFEQASSNTQMSTYIRWLQQVAPGASPSFYGVFAWSAAALFTQEAIKLGGKLTRASMVSALKGVHGWTNHKMTAPQDVGGKINGSCWRFVQLRGGKWVPVSGGYQCDGVTRG
ncbi:ABC transporter substrate-binding protein [Nocardioides terrisoli]|uniref:ABC transporter substrate-binding protein n=1 Tax=Nocardioides terrisoli TaxID=3388267 RepID=UPI00287B623B|nr:ABC transporter substrate-binding protein [Nocardioides marmorisolisilvae]